MLIDFPLVQMLNGVDVTCINGGTLHFTKHRNNVATLSLSCGIMGKESQ